jgi:tetratricopeptide (TPR) repeat protein
LDLQIGRLLAKAWMAMGQADRAVPLLEGRTGSDPSLALELALARYEAGDVQGASELLAPYSIEALDRFQSDESDSVDALSVSLIFEYGRILVAAAKHAEAIPFLEASVQLAPECKQCWQQMAQAYAARGHRQEAQSAQQRFKEILRTEAPAEERQRQEAQDQQDPTGRVLREAADVFQAGRTDEALAMLQTESRLRPNDPRTLHLAAKILVENGSAPQALELANSAIQIAPAYADGYYVRGTIFRVLGQIEEARQDFARALELAPEHRQAAVSLEQLPPR